MKIAVIDRGIDPTHRRLSKAKINGVKISIDGDQFTYTQDDFHDHDGHGTAIGSIIHKINPEIELVAVKLEADNDFITEPLLAEGIRYCCQNDDIKILNISMGVRSDVPNQALVEAYEEARKKDKIIVTASYPFQGGACFPASFPEVFGVGTGLVGSKLEYRYVGDNGSVNILAKGTTQRVAWKENTFKISAGTSYAAAHFSGLLSTKLHGYPTANYQYVVDHLLDDSRGEVEALTYYKDFEVDIIDQKKPDESFIEFFKPYECINFAKKVAIFPYTEKENKSLLMNRHNPAVEFTAYIDYPRSFTKIEGFETNQSEIEDRVIKRTLKEEDYSLFDTLVVGYYLEQMFNANIIFGNTLIKNCIERDKNFIVWDRHVFQYINRVIAEHPHEYKGKIYYPKVDKALFAKSNQLSYLPPVKAPVIGVIGTSSKQGKVTAQLKVKRLLDQEGYKVSHLCTEPQGALLGADFSFPFGYKSNVSLDQNHWPGMIENAMKSIQRVNNPHVIISGIQGELIPRQTVRSGGVKLGALNFITAVNPDAIICAVNPMDPIELVEDTVETLRKFIDFKLLFFVMTPWYRDFQYFNDKFIAKYKTLKKEEFRTKMEEFSQALGVQVIDILDSDNDQFIIESIQKAFSGN